MTSYRIITPLSTSLVVVNDDTVFQAAPALSFAVGRPWPFVREYAQRSGWLIEPLPDEHRPVWIEVGGLAYEILWNENAIQTITLHESGEEPRELTYDELPEFLKEQL